MIDTGHEKSRPGQDGLSMNRAIDQGTGPLSSAEVIELAQLRDRARELAEDRTYRASIENNRGLYWNVRVGDIIRGHDRKDWGVARVTEPAGNPGSVRSQSREVTLFRANVGAVTGTIYFGEMPVRILRESTPALAAAAAAAYARYVAGQRAELDNLRLELAA